MDHETIIALEHVGVRFGDTVVHRDISFHVDEGEVITILGPSGAGKTIILKLIIGLLKPSSGQVQVHQRDITPLSEVELVDARSEIGMLFQGAALFDSLSVFENVAYSLRERHVLGEVEIRERVEAKLALVGLPDIGAKFPSQLSGGQKKRVGLARALASQPKVMLFDEPTTGLDPTATRLIDDLILKLKNELRITSVVVTHDIQSAKRISDRWLLINDGYVVADGAVDQLMQSEPLVERFITGNWQE